MSTQLPTQLPKIDSPEWSQTWNLEMKINALNEAIQCLLYVPEESKLIKSKKGK